MRWIIDASLRFRLLLLPIVLALMAIGIMQVRDAPVDALPEFSSPRIEIQTEALGLSAEEVEQLVTVPLEADFLAGVPWLDDMNSESVPGLSSVEMIFEPGTDVLKARQMVQERLSQAFVLPNVSTPPVMLQPLSSTNRLMMVGLTSKDMSLMEMSVLSRWIIKPRLLGVPGVANVAVWGNREQQLQVQVDPNKLKDSGVTLSQVVSTTGNALWVSPLTFLEASTPGTGGFIDTPSQRLGVQHISPITKPADLAQVIIENQSGDKRLRLGDVAEVVQDHQPLIGDALVDNSPGLVLVVEKAPGANTTEVTAGVEAALDSLKPGLAGVTINTGIDRPATFIDTARQHIGLAAVISLVLLALVLGACYLDWRSTLISLVAVLVSLIAATAAVHLAGYSMNAMVLAGLVMGVAFVVGDAVADVTNIVRRAREHRLAGGTQVTAAVIRDASLEVRGPMAYATLIVLAASALMFFLPENTGLFFRPLALTLVASVLASTVVALTVTPALAMVLLRKVSGDPQPRLMRGPQRWYASALNRTTRRSGIAFGLAGVIALLGAGVLLLRPVAQTTIPAMQDRNLLVTMKAVAGTSGPEMVRVTTLAGRQLRELPGVTNVGTHVGRAISSDQVVGTNAGEIWLTMDPSADYAATRAAVERVVDGYPGLAHHVQTYPESRIDQLLDDVRDDVVVRVYGQDLGVLNAKAEEVKNALSGVPGLTDAHTQAVADEPTVQVKVDLAKAQKAGVKPGDVRRAAAALLSGVQAGSLFQDQKVFEVVVKGIPSTRGSLTGMRDLLIDTPDGGHVRLGDVADVTVAATPDVIKRDSVSRYVDVGATLSGRGSRAVIDEVEDKLAAVQLPAEYHTEIIGNYEVRQANQERLLLMGLAALIGVLLLLQAAVNSWRLAGALVLTLPVAAAGGLLLGAPFGLSALTTVVAFTAVVGIAAGISVLTVAHYRRLEQREQIPFGPELIMRGAQDRFPPLVTMVLAVIAVLLPLLVIGGPGVEVVRPLAAVIIGGLIVAALVNLFLLPALYQRFGAAPHPADLVGDHV